MCFYLPKTSVCVVMMCTSRDESARDQCQLPMGPLERKAGMWKHRADVTGMNTVARRHQRTTRSAASTPHWSTQRFRLRETPPMPSPRHGAETRGLWRWRRSSWALALAGPVQVVPVARTKPPAGQPPVPAFRASGSSARGAHSQPSQPVHPCACLPRPAAACKLAIVANANTPGAAALSEAELPKCVGVRVASWLPNPTSTPTPTPTPTHPTQTPPSATQNHSAPRLFPTPYTHHHRGEEHWQWRTPHTHTAPRRAAGVSI
jgi:hypothetical protein